LVPFGIYKSSTFPHPSIATQATGALPRPR